MPSRFFFLKLKGFNFVYKWCIELIIYMQLLWIDLGNWLLFYFSVEEEIEKNIFLKKRKKKSFKNKNTF